jgi:GNAT superfamily N-acetyltransferase
MLKFIRVEQDHPEFIRLVRFLDADLAMRDGKDHGFYAQFNSLTNLHHVILVQKNDQFVACGALKRFNNDSMEVKRMYVMPEFRGAGLASGLLNSLEAWMLEMGYKRSVLETGKRQPEAIKLYRKQGYRQTSNYGPYQGVENSLCFEKTLIKH